MSTTKPAETFTHLGETWTRHEPGKPCPVSRRAILRLLFRNDYVSDKSYATMVSWNKIPNAPENEIVGYAVIGQMRQR